MICSCCGHEFSDNDSRMSCDGCLLTKSCSLLKCPHCGFESAKEPAWIQIFRGFLKRMGWGGKSHCDPARDYLSLDDLNAGDLAAIDGFTDSGKMRKFTSLGILPGTHISVLRKHPAVVVRVGYSEFAFDRDLAASVKVQRL